MWLLDRVRFSSSSHTRIQGFKRQNACRTKRIQLTKVGDEKMALPRCVGDLLALKFTQSRIVAGLEIPLDRSPIAAEQAGLTRVSNRNFASAFRRYDAQDA
jgi:hypothetical protein